MPRFSRSEPPSGAGLADVHLLLLPAHAQPGDVEALVLTRLPDARDGGPGLRLSRHVRLTGPVVLDDATAAVAQVPPGWEVVYALQAPRERDEPPLPGLTDRDGLYRAFPGGLPVRSERRGVDLLVAVARRLGGAVRVAGSGVVLTPDPGAVVDLVVQAPYWLEPETTLAVCAAVAPAARLAVEGADWRGPPSGLVDAPLDAAAAALRPDLRVALHASADRLDAETLAAGTVLDAYAVAISIGRDGLVEVRVHVAESSPAALAGVPWADSVVSYEIRWSAAVESQAEHDAPGRAHIAARNSAHRLVVPLAAALVEAADGVPVDGDGFLVDRYDLRVL